MNKNIHYIFFCFSLYFSLVGIMAVVGVQAFYVAPGVFLFDRFHMAAFYIPIILYVGGIWFTKRRLPARLILILWLSPIVFITFAIALQTAMGRTNLAASGYIINTLGHLPAAVLGFLVFILEIAGIIKLAMLKKSESKIIQFFNRIRHKLHNAMYYLHIADPIYEENVAFATTRDRSEFEESRQEPESKSTDLPDANSDLHESVKEGNPTLVHYPDDYESEEYSFMDEEDQLSVSEKLSPQGMTPTGYFHKNNDWEESPTEDEFVQIDFSDYRFVGDETPMGIINEDSPVPARKNNKKYEIPVEGILANYPDSEYSEMDEATHTGSQILEQTLNEFKIEAWVTGIRKGPVITMYELLPSPGVKISSIVNLQDNIALRLAASRVRIVAPIPGKHAVGIEVPNKKRSIVSFSTMVGSNEFCKMDGIPVILGKDISGDNQVIDLTRTPHLLIAGATGSGKSVCVNSLIASILYSRNPHEVKLIMVDPKIVELKLYNDIPHLLAPVITEPKRAIQALQWCLCEMERRYNLLDTQGVRDMLSYNRKIAERKLATEPLPYIVVIVDEFADLMAVSGKELEVIVARLAAMSRAVGIHLVLATQRPSVDVITGLIKANFPSRIAFMVAQKTDSRIIIDAMGAEKLLGRGDMLFTSAWDPFPFRIQGAYLSEEEVERVVDCVKEFGEPDYIDDEMFFDEEDDENFQLEADSGDDPMYEKALEIVVHSRKASASYLQRRLKIGYNRAARLVEEMEHRGIVGPANGSKARDILHVPERMREEEESA